MGGPVFAGRDGDGKPVQISRTVRGGKKDAEKVEEWRLHDLRHWSATFALSEGYDLAVVVGRLGHSDPSTTLRVYAHARSQRERRAGDEPG